MHVVYIIKHEIVIPRSSAYPAESKGGVTVWYQSVTTQNVRVLQFRIKALQLRI
jgi:hypothetical protein